VARIINTADLLETSALDYNAREWVYNGLDCAVTLELRDAMLPLLDNVTASTYAFSRALQAPVLEMTMRGVLVDEQQRAAVLASYRDQIDLLDRQLTRLVAEGIGMDSVLTPFKDKQRWWRSWQQLQVLFYDIMKLPPVRKRNSKGVWAPTTDRDALEKLDGYFIAGPIVQHLLALRNLDKKRGFLETAVDADGRIRCNFNIGGTNTGRLASSMSDFGTGTNLQNVDRELRSVFVADPGWVFVNLDLEQGDARNVGAICWNAFVNQYGEAYAGAYLDACESGDLHTTNARLIWPELAWTGDLAKDKAIAEVIFYRQDSYRQMSKKGGHGSNYYGTPRTMAQHLKVDTPVIDDFQRRYFKAYPVIGSYKPKDNDPGFKLPNWHNRVRRQLADEHSLTTMLGRRRRFFGRSFEDSTLRDAIAYEPQSMTADEIDGGLIRVWGHHRVVPLVQVHDSVLFMVREEELDETVPWLLKEMRTRIILEKDREFAVPTEAKVGWNWGDFDPKSNVDGLKKWKGSESRTRTRIPRRAARSLADLLA
jgi:DNA polymerase I-like protein with 3'-5' exonuclease and polymerase domains